MHSVGSHAVYLRGDIGPMSAGYQLDVKIVGASRHRHLRHQPDIGLRFRSSAPTGPSPPAIKGIPKAARPPKHSFPEHVQFCGLGTPGLQSTTWPKNHFEIPLMQGNHQGIELLAAVVEDVLEDSRADFVKQTAMYRDEEPCTRTCSLGAAAPPDPPPEGC